MKRLKLIDEIIKEPLGGAHSDREATFIAVRDAIVKSYDRVKKLITKRIGKTKDGKIF